MPFVSMHVIPMLIYSNNINNNIVISLCKINLKHIISMREASNNEKAVDPENFTVHHANFDDVTKTVEYEIESILIQPEGWKPH